MKQLHMFKQNSVRQLIQLKKSYLNLDKKESLKYALAIAGESSAINATYILEKCIRIEKLITREQWDTVGQLIERLDEEIKLLCIEIEKHPLERPIIEETTLAS